MTVPPASQHADAIYRLVPTVGLTATVPRPSLLQALILVLRGNLVYLSDKPACGGVQLLMLG